GGSVGRAVLALVALAAVALVLPAGFTVAAWVLVPPVVALAALGARRGVADADALRRLVPLAAGFVAVAGAAFAPALAALRRGGDAAPLAPSALAATAALQLYPRADFVHLMPLGVLLLPLVLRVWARLPLPRPALIALPLLVAAVRFAPTGLVLGRLASGRITHVALGATDLVVDPAGAQPPRAIVRA